MPSLPTCGCPLCRIETELAAELRSSVAVFDRIRDSATNGLQAFASPFQLLAHLRATPTASSADDLFRELLASRAAEPAYIEPLIILAFLPVLHGTVRRIAKQQSRLARADIVQQSVSTLLQVLRSHDLQNRQSHFAFAISRALKRQLFEWAAREGSAHEPQQPDYAGPQMDEYASVERHTALRHFLHRCLVKGLLDDAELNLLVQIKLDGNSGEEIAELHAITSNAVRQRTKRLLAKLRQIALNGSSSKAARHIIPPSR